MTKLGQLASGAVFVVAGLFGLFLAFGKVGLRINTSPSLPVGLYIESADGPLVEFCPPEPWGRLAAERGYRTRGVCRDGASPLLKPVVACAGELVELTPAGVILSGRLVPNTAPLAKDVRGRNLDHFAFGQVIVPAGAIWTASSHSPRSFDSRYMGTIPVATIRARVRPLLTLW